MNSKQKTNWWIDVFLLISFLITFFLDITGLIAHQWIGIISFSLAAFHLFLHRKWVKSTAQHFFRKRVGKQRLYFLVDLSILLGFSAIIFTVLIMSTWLNLPLPNYDVWHTVHILNSITTLVAILLKLVMHMRWIEQATRKMLTRAVSVPAKNLVVQPAVDNSKRMGRRQFLTSLGVVSTASVMALASASKSLAETINTSDSAELETEATPTTTNTQTATQNVEATATEQATETVEATAEPTATVASPTQTATEAATQSIATAVPTAETNCTVRCGRGCSYPGHCHRYTDANANNLCDLGECL